MNDSIRFDSDHPHLQKGAHATHVVGSDRYPYEIITANFFASGKKAGLVKSVLARQLKSLGGGAFASWTGRPVREFRAKYPKGSNTPDLMGLRLDGVAESYLDPSF